MESLIIKLQEGGFIEAVTIENEEIFVLSTPCRFVIDEFVVNSLRGNYLSDEEIGGILWAQPIMANNERIFQIKRISYVRNAIEDNPRADNRNKSNAYLPDMRQLHNELEHVFYNECLPIKFHTHPVKSNEILQKYANQYLNSETSEQDRIESSNSFKIGTKRLLLPRSLIVGSDFSSHGLFIGIYNGFIAPLDFVESKHKIQDENLKRTIELFSDVKLNERQKAFVAIGGCLLLFSILRYPKYSVPVILGLSAMMPALFSNTQNLERINYFNKISNGDADIYIPKVES